LGWPALSATLLWGSLTTFLYLAGSYPLPITQRLNVTLL
jgi:hypothetical protein